MIDWIYDIECFPNYFSIGLQRVDTSETFYYEISDRRNDYNKLIQALNYMQSIGSRMIGFNSIGYDYPVIHWIYKANQPLSIDIYNKSSTIINTDWNNRFANRVWESDHIIQQVDLMLVHHFDNSARRCSLKQLEFAMRRQNVADLPIEPGTYLTHDQMDDMACYLLNDDIPSTREFYDHSKDELKLRDDLSAKYPRNFTNDNDTKIGKQYFIMELEKSLPGSCYDSNRKPRQTKRPEIDLGQAVFPWIQFRTPEFQYVADYFRRTKIKQTKGAFSGIGGFGDNIDLKVGIKKKGNNKSIFANVGGLDFIFGTGGIHASVENKIFESNDEYVIVDLDVASYYPNLAIVNNLYPAHLSDKFCNVYLDVYNQRKQYGKKTAENKMFKLALNGVYGDSNSQYSPFYDPLYTMSITINGQLLLCKLAEDLLTIPNLRLIQANTDGVTVYLPRKYLPQLQNISRQWEQQTKLELEDVEYSRMFIKNVNSYIGEYMDGSLKNKKDYLWSQPNDRTPTGWHQNLSALIVGKTAEACLLHGYDPETVIRSCKDPYDFCLFFKSGKRLLLGGEAIQRRSRLYFTNDGQELLVESNTTAPQRKKNPDVLLKYAAPSGTKDWKLSECNNMSDFDWNKLNYDWYIEEAKKLIDPLVKI